MNASSKVPCEECQKALHKHDTIEYLYCGHNQVVAFRYRDGDIDFVGVNSTEEAITLIQETGQSAMPQSMPA